MSKITSLTPEQEAMLPVWRDRWTNIGLSCEPLNREAAEDAVRRAYAVAKLPPPKLFVVADSPLSGAIVATTLKDGDSVWDGVWASVRASVGDSVWASVRDSVVASVRDSVWASVWASVRASVGASVWASVRASVRASVWASVRDSVSDSVGASVRASVRDSVSDSVSDSVYGSHDAHWLGFYEYFLANCELTEEVAPLQPLIDLAQHCGWWIPYENVCILQHRHSALHRDADGRLHNANGPAVVYRDGWGVYMWHGTRLPVDRQWIIDDPNRIDIAAIDAEDNAEIRRVMLEMFGHDRYIAESGMKPVQADEYGELFRREQRGDEELVMVRVTNSTPEPDGSHKLYWLRVPPTVRTPHEAVAWSFGMTASEYAPAEES